MKELTTDALGEWESEGGAPAQSEPGFSLAPPTAAATQALTGTVSQIDWAEHITGQSTLRKGSARTSTGLRTR